MTPLIAYESSPFLSFVASFVDAGALGPFVVVLASTLHGVIFLSPLVFAGYYADSKLTADAQMRIGPNRVGVFGIWQPLSDFFKLLLKENRLFASGKLSMAAGGPVFALSMVYMAFASLPISGQWALFSFEWSILFAITAMVVSQYVLFYAAYSQNKSWSIISSVRMVFLSSAYIAPLLMAVAPVFLISGSGSFSGVLNKQAGAPWAWILFNYPTTIISMFALWFLLLIWQNRAPFDTAVSQSEIYGGVIGSYGASRLGLLRLLSLSQLILGSGIIVTLFLGGYKFPFELAALERAANIFEYAIFLAKVAIVTAVSLWVTYSMPRARIDQVSFFSWHLLMPLSIVSYILTLIWVATTGGRGLWVEL